MKTVCPYCFNQFTSSEVLFRCSNTSVGCANVRDEAMDKFWGDTRPYKRVLYPKKSLLGGVPKSAVCECGNVSYKTICPQCHNELPREMVEKGGVIISIIGARSSGKTNYITTLINELTHKGHHLNIGIYPTVVGRDAKEQTEARYKDDFFNILYKNKRCPEQTDPNSERSKIPLIYKLFSTKVNKHAYLVLYDTAGENFEKIENIRGKAIFLKNSDGIIMLLDTFCIDDVRDRLNAKLKLGNKETDYNEIIKNIVAYFDEQPNKADYYKKPLALTFSKIDAIIANEDEFSDARLPNINMNANSQYLEGGSYELGEVESIDMGIKAGLESWGEKHFIDNINAPGHFNGKATFFGISALGNMPSPENTVKNIKPFRVLDPLIWILYRLNFPLPIKK